MYCFVPFRWERTDSNAQTLTHKKSILLINKNEPRNKKRCFSSKGLRRYEVCGLEENSNAICCRPRLCWLRLAGWLSVTAQEHSSNRIHEQCERDVECLRHVTLLIITIIIIGICISSKSSRVVEDTLQHSFIQQNKSSRGLFTNVLDSRRLRYTNTTAIMSL